jgi:hypothetical protein
MENGNMLNYDRCIEILTEDYGTCYTIGNFQLCPEKRLIRVGRKFGNETEDAFGYFPEPSLKYDEETLVIFAGNVFFLSSCRNIDWRTVRLLSYHRERSEFTDGKRLYRIRYGSLEEKGAYDAAAYRPPKDDESGKRIFPEDWGFTDEGESFVDEDAYDGPERRALGRQHYVEYYVKGDTFCYNGLPILGQFDIRGLRTIVSKDGFETDYITDGKKVFFGGPRGGYTSAEKDGTEYVLVEELMIDGVDLNSLRVLGEDILADKNALYCRTNAIPFDKLDGFRFILRDM